jgi:hypothetical protein
LIAGIIVEKITHIFGPTSVGGSNYKLISNDLHRKRPPLFALQVPTVYQ